MSRFHATEFGKCARCGRKFVPDWYDLLAKFSTCCQVCSARNIAERAQDEAREACRVIALLVAAGHVSEEKVEQAREFARPTEALAGVKE